MAGSYAADLRVACACLAAGRAEEAQTRFSALEPGIVAQCGSLVARGLIHEQAGRLVVAATAFDQAAALGAPITELVREIARWFVRCGRHRQAYGQYVLLERLDPGSLAELFTDDLPPESLARLGAWALRREVSAERPRHWVYPAYKEALASWLGAPDAAVAFCALAGFEIAEVRRLPLRLLRDYAVEHSPDFEELSPSHPIWMPAPRVHGRERGSSMASTSRSVFFATLGDVVVPSKGDLILTGDAALLDAQVDELAKVPVDLSYEPELVTAEWLPARAGEELTLLASSGPTLDRAFHLVGVNSYNFGHWHMEFLPKVWACRDRPGFADVPILVDEQMPEQNFEALRLLLGGEPLVHIVPRGACVRVRELWVCAMTVYFPPAPAWGVDAARDLHACDDTPFVGFLEALAPRLDALVGPPRGTRRLFLTRQDHQHRRMVNRQEVEQWFVAQGFEVHDFAQRTFLEQLQLVRSAGVVVGPDGSSLVTTFYAGPDTRVGVLNNPYLDDNESYINICEGLGQRVLHLVGDVVEPGQHYRYRASYSIDVDALPGFLDALTAP